MTRRELLGSIIGTFVVSGFPFVAKAGPLRTEQLDPVKFFRSPDLRAYKLVICTSIGELEGPEITSIKTSGTLTSTPYCILPSKIIWKSDDLHVTQTYEALGIKVVNPYKEISVLRRLNGPPCLVPGDILRATYELSMMPDRGQLEGYPPVMRDYV